MNLFHRGSTLWFDLKSKLYGSKKIETWQRPESLRSYDGFTALRIIDATIKSGNYEDALQIIILTYEELNIENSGLLCEWLSHWSTLSTKNSRAKKAYIKQRDKAESDCWSNMHDTECFAAVRNFNEMIGMDRRTIRLFQKIAKVDINAAQELYRCIEDTLIYYERYSECMPFLNDWQTRLKCRIGEHLSDKRYMDSIGDYSTLGVSTEYFRYETSKIVGLLSKNNRKSEAEDAASQCLAVDGDEEYGTAIRDAIDGRLPAVWHGYAPMVFDEHQESIGSL